MNRTNRIELIHLIGGGAVMSELIDIISKKDKLLDFMEIQPQWIEGSNRGTVKRIYQGGN